MTYLRIIGDIHGEYKDYLQLIKDCKYSVQVGDFGFQYDILNEVDSNYHKINLGNHDNYDICYSWPHILKPFGINKIGSVEFFNVRGGFSIDWKMRIDHYYKTGRVCYWPKEQLNPIECKQALDEYKKSKPEIIISHSCPKQVADKIGNSQVLRNWGYNPKTFTTTTQELLQLMYNDYQPRLWLFGHFHLNRRITFKKNGNETNFICIDSQQYIDLNNKGINNG